MSIEELRKLLAGKSKALAEMQTKATAEDASDEDVQALEDAVAAIEKLEKKLAAAEKAEAASARLAKAADTPVGEDEDEDVVVEPTFKRKTDGVLKIGLLGIAAASVKRGMFDNVYDALTKNGYGQVADEFHAATRRKSLTAGTAVSGGILVPDTMASQIIEFLRPQTAFLRGNPRRIPMPNGSYNQAGGATGAVAAYGPELGNATVTEPTFRDINMTAKELKALVPVSNQFLDFSLESARQFVEDDLRMALSEKMDNTAFLGTGLQSTPLGLYNVPGIGTSAATDSTTPTLAQVDGDLRDAINGLVTNNVPLAGAAWVISRRILGYMEDLRDGNGNFAFPTLQSDNPTLKRIPVLDTTNIPENLGGGSNEGYMALVNFNHVLFGEAGGMEFSVSSEAAYYDATSTWRSAFQRGETLMLAMMRHDFGLRHLPAVYVKTAVKWGA